MKIFLSTGMTLDEFDTWCEDPGTGDTSIYDLNLQYVSPLGAFADAELAMAKAKERVEREFAEANGCWPTFEWKDSDWHEEPFNGGRRDRSADCYHGEQFVGSALIMELELQA